MYISLYMENEYEVCNDGENTLHKEQVVHLAAILHQPEQPKWKIGDHMEKRNSMENHSGVNLPFHTHWACV